VKLFTDSDLEKYVHGRIVAALEDAEKAYSDRSQWAETQHKWAVERLEARVEDAERHASVFRTGYKNALKKLKRYRKELSQAKRTLLAAGLANEVDEKTGKPKVTPAQEIMDEIESLIPGLDDLSRGAVRSYVDRELRKRGSGDKENILQEVATGGYQDDDSI
jgi:hypothetical protein